jgi:hypothetical protein
MMLGGVGFQAGLDETRRKQLAARTAAAPKPDVVEQLKALKALHDDGALTPEEFRLAKQMVLRG